MKKSKEKTGIMGKTKIGIGTKKMYEYANDMEEGSVVETLPLSMKRKSYIKDLSLSFMVIRIPDKCDQSLSKL